MAYKETININLGFNMNNIITITQFSTGNKFNFYVDDYTIPDDADVKIFVKKPSGHEVLCDCLYSNNVIISPCTIQMVAELGQSNCQILIFEDGQYLCSFKFTLNVTENIYAAMQVESSDEYRTLEDLIVSASYIIELVNAQEADRVTAESTRIENENLRIENEAARLSAESTRSNSEEYRVSNESQRIENENIRKNNETDRQTNENARIAAENVRSSNEVTRGNTFANWAEAIASVKDFEDDVADLKAPGKYYVPLNSNTITRGTYDANAELYTSGCRLEYDPTIEGLVISFI